MFLEVYPRKEDPKAFSKYLEEQRALITTADWEAHEQARRRVRKTTKLRAEVSNPNTINHFLRQSTYLTNIYAGLPHGESHIEGTVLTAHGGFA